MPVRFARGPPGHAAQDVVNALEEADANGDTSSVRLILDLLCQHLEEELASMLRPELEHFLSTRRVWREYDVHPVFKTADTPCITYTVLEQDDELALTVLGCCYRYPRSERDWWESVILPRLRHYL
jgi:hypothetical protein